MKTIMSRAVVIGLYLAITCQASLSPTSRNLERIAGYDAKSSIVKDKSRIDLDQVELKRYLSQGTKDGLDKAHKIYQKGIHSYPVATLRITGGEPKQLAQGSLIIGMSETKRVVYGTVTMDHKEDDTKIMISYDTSSDRGEYIPCEVGGNPNPFTAGCLASKGSIIIDNQGSFDYEYDILQDNSNEASLYGFSEHEAEKMFHCKHDCPYPDYEKFYNYYGQLDYGDLWIEAAFEGRSTNYKTVGFARGNVDFSRLSLKARAEAIQRATVYMNVFIHVYRTMQEFSIERCRAGNPSERGHWSDPVTNWDSAVAIYTGSLEGSEGGTGEGQLLYALADETCGAFKTCGEMKTSTEGTSSVNLEIFAHFRDGQRHLEQKQCDGAQAKKDRIIQLMTVPLIQGTLRSAYILENNESTNKEQQEAVAASFAAAILPDVHYCNADDAQIIYNELQVGREGRARFLNVKSAFERNYECLGVTCDDVGGYFDIVNGRYFKNASPCGSKGRMGGRGTPPAARWALLAFLGCFVALGVVFRSRDRVLEFAANTRYGVRVLDSGTEDNTLELRYRRVVTEEVDHPNMEG